MEEYVCKVVVTFYVEWPDMGHPWFVCDFFGCYLLEAKHLTFKGWEDNKIVSALVVLTVFLFIYMCIYLFFFMCLKKSGTFTIYAENPEISVDCILKLCGSRKYPYPPPPPHGGFFQV